MLIVDTVQQKSQRRGNYEHDTTTIASINRAVWLIPVTLRTVLKKRQRLFHSEERTFTVRVGISDTDQLRLLSKPPFSTSFP